MFSNPMFTFGRAHWARIGLFVSDGTLVMHGLLNGLPSMQIFRILAQREPGLGFLGFRSFSRVHIQFDISQVFTRRVGWALQRDIGN
jgi:hypothetical protein